MADIKLSPAQERAMAFLTSEWQGSYALGVGLNTLNALVRKGLAERKAVDGSWFQPHHMIKYRRRAMK